MIWHSAQLEDILNILNSDKEKGLSNGVAQSRSEQYGYNSLSFHRERSFFKAFLSQFNNFSVIALLAVAVLSLIVTLISHDKQFFSPILIFTIVIINNTVCAYQEIKSEDSADVLKDISAPTATVIRDGIKKVIDSSLLVPGDIICLKEGDYISADARIISSMALCCDESPLTGNHVPIDKVTDIVLDDITPLEERANMVFAGCSVRHGSCVAVVTATGLETEIGKERSILEQTGSTKIPIKESVVAFSKAFSTAVLIVSFILFAIGMIYNFKNSNISRTLIDTFLSSMALAVAVIPEGLPAATAVILTLGIQRLITKNALVKDFSSVETMGGVSVICSDKTGTLTENKMIVTKVFNGRNIIELDGSDGDDIKMILELATICNNASESDGDPTGMGIAEACLKLTGMNKQDIENLYPRLGEVPFDAVRKLMTTINMINGKTFAIVKGAPETLLPLCVGSSAEKFSPVSEALAEDGLRIIAVAAKQIDEIPANPSAEELECNLNFIGLIGLEDSPRAEAVRAVEECKAAGIRTIMLTSDHPLTAKAMARRLGILTDDTEMLTGVMLESMSDEELCASIEKYSVYARITSDDRLRIVRAWQAAGHCVAVTGDSVDDTPALMAADVGCAMGKSGTDVAKGVSDIILTNDDFTSIVNSVKEGRTIFSNIRKSLNYLISSNLGELLFVLLATIIFGTIPLTAVMLLWVNLITDLSPVIALGMEPPEKDVMSTLPQKRQTVFNKKLLTSFALQGALVAVVSIISYSIGLNIGTAAASTMAFITLIFSQVLFTLSARTENIPSVLSLKNNKFALYSCLLSVALVLIVAVTPLRALFSLELIAFGYWVNAILLSIVPTLVAEGIKLIKYLKKA